LPLKNKIKEELFGKKIVKIVNKECLVQERVCGLINERMGKRIPLLNTKKKGCGIAIGDYQQKLFRRLDTVPE
jgi:hypothetical protein